MTKTLCDSFSVSMKIDKGILTVDQKEQILSILNKTFEKCTKATVEAKFSVRGDQEILSLDVDTHFLATAKMVIYAVLESFGVNPHWGYEID